jgi:5-methylphenazine-1-carboxylate 1-monooxygenase
MSSSVRVAVIGGGVGGLTLALGLHAAGIESRVFEAVPELTAVGVGINLLPHASRQLARLGLLGDLAAVAVATRESVYFNRFGQHIYTEPSGTSAGYAWPQFSIHRGDLQTVLARAVCDRLGPDALATGHRCVRVEQDDSGVTIHFARPTAARRPSAPTGWSAATASIPPCAGSCTPAKAHLFTPGTTCGAESPYGIRS